MHPRGTVPGRRSTTASYAGHGTVPGRGSWLRCFLKWSGAARSTGSSFAWMAPASVLSRPQPERGEKTRTPGEPPDHALGRSRGGIGSKLHVGGRGLRGYTKDQFLDAWSRYLPDESATPATPAISAGHSPDLFATGRAGGADDLLHDPGSAPQDFDETAGQMACGARGADVADRSQGTPAYRCGCGVELKRPESVARGCCAECALLEKGAD